MRVTSGVAVSFDGKSSEYLPLPPLLPRRPEAWYSSHSPLLSTNGTDCGSRGNIGGDTVPTSKGVAREACEMRDSGGGGGVSTCWEALPGRAVETMALFVSLWCCLMLPPLCLLPRYLLCLRFYIPLLSLSLRSVCLFFLCELSNRRIVLSVGRQTRKQKFTFFRENETLTRLRL